MATFPPLSPLAPVTCSGVLPSEIVSMVMLSTLSPPRESSLRHPRRGNRIPHPRRVPWRYRNFWKRPSLGRVSITMSQYTVLIWGPTVGQYSIRFAKLGGLTRVDLASKSEGSSRDSVGMARAPQHGG